MRVDAETANEISVELTFFVLIHPRRPQSSTSQGLFEVADGRPGHRIDHLLVELGAGFRWRQAILGQEMGLVQIHRRVADPTSWIHVDHLEVVVDRSFRKLVLPRHLHGDHVDVG